MFRGFLHVLIVPNTRLRWNWNLQQPVIFILDLTDQFGDIVDNYMDTLRTDYAFIVSPLPFVKSMVQSSYEDAVIEPEWDYSLFPNPTRSEFFVRLKNGAARMTSHSMISQVDLFRHGIMLVEA